MAGLGAPTSVMRLGAAALAAAVFTLSSADAVAGGPAHPVSTVGARIAWRPCKPPGPRLQCARIPVPLDWDHPNGATIHLALIRHLASKPKQRIGTMFFNPGGPGTSGVDTVRGAAGDLDAMGRGRFNVVSWDPRGTNASTHVRCFHSKRGERRFWKGESIPITKQQSRRFRVKTTALARRCGRVGGRLLRDVSTADSARDLDYLRRLAGDRKLSYFGISYGTFLGQTYANMFPRRVRAMLLDGIVDPVTWTSGAEEHVNGAVSSADEVFAKFLSLCESAGPQRCALAGHSRSPAERVKGLFVRLSREPIPAPAASPPGKLTYGDLLLSLFEPLRNPAVWPQLARDLDAAASGDGSALETEGRKLRTPVAWSGVTTSDAIQCTDAAPARRGSRAWPKVLGQLEHTSYLQGPVQGWWTWAPCASWPVRAADHYAGPWNASTKDPILVIGTRYDPNTGYANARRVARLLGNAVLLTHDGYGHVSFEDPSECVDRAKSAYLVHLVTPPRGTVCPSDRKPFDPSFGKPLP